MLRWTKQFATGHQVIDAQHQELISYINRLESLASYTTNPSREDLEFILNLIDFVEDYTAVHFQHEEACMVRLRCPAYGKNKTAHTQFLEFFRQFKQRFANDGCRPEVLRELHETCASWIQEHILHIDVQLRACVDPTPAGEAPT